jgi:TatD DNase family protein
LTAYTDSHAHLSLVADELGGEALAALLRDYAEAWAGAVRDGLPGPLLLDPGVEAGDLIPRLELLGGPGGLPPFLRLAAGVWPSQGSLASPEASLGALEASIAAASGRGVSVAAIGEGGLDYHHMDGSREAQATLFRGQLEVAARMGLPMIVHSRGAAADTLELVEGARGASPVILHCFGYGRAEALSFLAAGCWISFAGNLSFKGSEALREACAAVPADRFLLETDAPYMNPLPRRGKPSSPADIARSYALAAELRGVSVADLAETVSRNAHILFR